MALRTDSAFARQVHTYEDRIHGFASAFLKDASKAKDVTQDVLIKLWKHRDDLDDNGVFSWLMRVTRNACIDVLRARQRRQQTMTVNTEHLDRAESPLPSPDTTAETTDLRARIHEALNHVDEPYRRVVELRELQEMKYREIADTLDMPLNTVKVYIHRGRKQLRRQLSEQLDYGPV